MLSIDREPGATGRSPKRNAPKKGAARGGRARSGRAKKRSPRRSRSFFGWLVSVALFFVIVGFATVGSALFYFAQDLPNMAELRIPKRPPSITVVSGDGEIMGRRGLVHAGLVRYEELPPHLVQAVIAIEDERFFDHIGIDFQGLLRAAWANFRAGRVVQGGSTLTQQLAKNLFLKPDRTYRRKIQEMILAIRLEQEFSKEEIIELYLNRVYFGAGTYGIEAAAERYFEKSARDITLSESAILAGLLKAPSRYAPTTNEDRAVTRAQVVLDNMFKAGFVTEEERFVAGQMLRMPRAQAETFETAPYILDFVAEELPEVIGEPQGDLVVETSVDLDMQRIAEEAAAKAIAAEGADKKVEQASVVLMTNTGAIKALVGGLNYHDSQFNRAVKGLRQPGSTFKVFVYLAALEYGFTPWDVRIDQPIRIRDWEPKNYGNGYRGPVTIDEALTRSINTVAAQVADEVGVYSVIDVAHRLGIEQDLPNSPSLALGTGEVTLLQLTGAFANIANGGIMVRPHVISRVLSPDGRVLYEHVDDAANRVLTPVAVADMNLMLSHVVAGGTGTRARLDGHEVAGKTGTTQDYRDAWFIGYTGHFTAGVWVGNDDNSAMAKVTGGSLPATIWHDVMTQVHEGLEPVALPTTRPPAEPQYYSGDGSPLGSFLGGLFGVGGGQPDPRAADSYRYGYRYYPDGTGSLPPGAYPPSPTGYPPPPGYPVSGGYPPYGAQPLPPQYAPAAQNRRDEPEQPKTRLLLGRSARENAR